eukprot:216416-Amorphochlora_amoeboformis.AAC.1
MGPSMAKPPDIKRMHNVKSSKHTQEGEKNNTRISSRKTVRKPGPAFDHRLLRPSARVHVAQRKDRLGRRRRPCGAERCLCRGECDSDLEEAQSYVQNLPGVSDS